MKRIFLFFLSVLLYALTYAQPGTPDPSFGDKGKVLSTTLLSGGETALGVQKDGRIIIGSGGKYKSFYTFKVTCLLPDGSLDTSFGKGGSAYASFPGFRDTVNDNAYITTLAVTKEGKIVAAGYAVETEGGGIPIARFLPDGSVDSSFGTNGVSISSFNEIVFINTIALQEDGKIILGGSSSKDIGGSVSAFLARYTPDGSVDKSFGDAGQIIITKALVVNSILVQPDASIVAAGAGGVNINSNPRAYLERRNSSGKLDESFGNGGYILDGNMALILYSIALQPDGRIVAAGFGSSLISNIWTVLRYTANGKLDPSFGNNGKVTTTSFPSTYGTVQKVFVSGSHIVAAGTASDGITISDFALTGYNMDGSPDAGFGKEGVTVTDLGAYDGVASAAQQPDGKLLLLGGIYTEEPPYNTGAIVRYNGYPVHLSLAVRIRRWLQSHGIRWNGLPAEDKVAYYSVEQSADGKDFTQIARVSGAANLSEYSLTNAHLLDGINYYRIKAVSTDGEVRYSEVASADNTANTASVFPNPARSSITVQGLNTSEKAAIAIKDAGGTVLARGVSSGSTQYRSSVSHLLPGTYYLNITTKNKTETLKFVKE